MKASKQQYAQALLAASDGLSTTALTALSQRFAAVLRAEGKLSWWPEIEQSFKKLWENKHGLATLELYSARSLSSSELQRLTDIFTAKLQRQISWKMILDRNLIAGFRIKYQDRVWDCSLREGLCQLRQSIES
jgi:F-type H+-transporting ATPase subunit delta